MSDEVNQVEEVKPNETVEVKPKQYLLMADEVTLIFLTKLIPSLQYVQVEGLGIDGNPNHQFLVNPICKSPVMMT